MSWWNKFKCWLGLHDLRMRTSETRTSLDIFRACRNCAFEKNFIHVEARGLCAPSSPSAPSPSNFLANDWQTTKGVVEENLRKLVHRAVEQRAMVYELQGYSAFDARNQALFDWYDEGSGADPRKEGTLKGYRASPSIPQNPSRQETMGTSKGYWKVTRPIFKAIARATSKKRKTPTPPYNRNTKKTK